jgi:hypothetical protein
VVGRVLYIEGGGDGKALRTRCREGFEKLLRNAGCSGRMPRIVACGGRAQAFEDFQAKLRDPDASPVLLVDAEAPVEGQDPWAHVRARKGDGWTRPDAASGEQLHLMVQLMESWLIADRSALASFFGNGFREGALPRGTRLEEIPKRDVTSGLGEASRNSRKGEYHKGNHSFALLGCIDVARLSAASPWARRFFEHMRADE